MALEEGTLSDTESDGLSPHDTVTPQDVFDFEVDQQAFRPNFKIAFQEEEEEEDVYQSYQCPPPDVTATTATPATQGQLLRGRQDNTRTVGLGGGERRRDCCIQ